MSMKLISPNCLSKLRRGAEHLYRKHRDRLASAEITVKQEIAAELGLPVMMKSAQPIPAVRDQAVGIFDDEPADKMVQPTVMTRVKLVDYIEALKKYDPSPVKESK